MVTMYGTWYTFVLLMVEKEIKFRNYLHGRRLGGKHMDPDHSSSYWNKN